MDYLTEFEDDNDPGNLFEILAKFFTFCFFTWLFLAEILEAIVKLIKAIAE